jgi:predicted small lipoprotein YifL
MMVRHFALLLALAGAGCGIKGPLYLPPAAQPLPAAPATAQPPVAPGPSSPPPPANPTAPVEKRN